MALQDQPVSIQYGKGVDTKTSKFTVQTGKLLRLQDATFTKINQLDKRPGTDAMTLSILGGGLLNKPGMTGSYNNELVCTGTASGATINGQRIFSYSTQEDRWVDKGKYTPIKVETKNIAQTIESQFNPTVALLGNIALFASCNQLSPSVPIGTMNVDVWDMNTETVLYSNSSFSVVPSGRVSNPICVVLGGTQLALLYETETFPGPFNSLVLQTVTVTPSGGVVFGPQVIIANLSAALSSSQLYVVTGTPTGATISYTSSASVPTLITINTAGATTHTLVITDQFLSISTDPNTGFTWGYWVSGTNTLHYVIYDSTLTLQNGPFTVTSAQAGNAIAITSITVAPNVQQVAYSFETTFTGPTSIFFTYQRQLSNTGTAIQPLTGLASQCLIYSKFFLVKDPLGNDIPYIALSNVNSIVQPTVFIMDATMDSTKGTTGIVAKAFMNAAFDLKTNFNLSTVVSLSPTKILIPVSASVQPVIPLLALEYMTLDFANQDTSQAISIPNKSMVFNGGIVTMYDSQPAVELGFNLFPEIVTQGSAVGGSLDNGTYQVFAVYQWTDAEGNLHQSAASPPKTVIFPGSGAATNSITVTVPYLSITQKQPPDGRSDLGVAVFVTQANLVVPYSIPNTTNAVPAMSFPNHATVDFTAPGLNVLVLTVTTVDPSRPILYTNGGILDNDPPPPTTAMVVHNNRLQLVDSSNANSQWYSKSLTPGVGISFSGFLINQIDPHAGSLVALAEMDEKLILFAQNAPIVLSGDGANDAGTGSTLSFPQFIPSDVGCSQSKGVITSPLGVHFKTPKGIFLLDRSLSLKYWGYPVEDFNFQDITSSIIMPGTTQIRFLTSAGLTLVYDYFQDQWSTFTNYQGLGATIWNRLYVYARSDGNIYKENLTSFLDGGAVPYGWKAQTSWIKGTVIQGFQRLKEFLQLGEYANGTDPGHGMQVSIAYDFLSNPDLPGFSTPVPYLFGGASTSGSIQYRQFIEQQKCEAATFLIEEIVTGASGEDLTLTDMTMVAGIKKGAFKLPVDQTASSGA